MRNEADWQDHHPSHAGMMMCMHHRGVSCPKQPLQLKRMARRIRNYLHYSPAAKRILPCGIDHHPPPIFLFKASINRRSAAFSADAMRYPRATKPRVAYPVTPSTRVHQAPRPYLRSNSLQPISINFLFLSLASSPFLAVGDSRQVHKIRWTDSA